MTDTNKTPKIFISWSGPISRRIATALYDWLPDVIQNVDLFMSEEDTPKGSTWQSEILGHLEASNCGIICQTPENINSQWLHFEVGRVRNLLRTPKTHPSSPACVAQLRTLPC